MNKKYYLLYLKNTDTLKTLVKRTNTDDDTGDENIKFADLPFNTYLNSELSSGQREVLFAYLKEKLGLADGAEFVQPKKPNGFYLNIPELFSEPEPQPRKCTLAEALDLKYPTKQFLINDLEHVIKNFEGSIELKPQLEKLLKVVKESRDAMLSIERDVPNISIKEGFTIPILNISIPEPIVKLADERLFDFNKAQNEKYFPTEVAVQTPFDGLSRKKLIALFQPENFYQLSKESVKDLLQAAASEYLQSEGVEPCAVVFENLTYTERKLQRGSYEPNRGAIILNKRILDQFEDAKAKRDPNFAYQMLSTVIHESQHRKQFSMRSNNSQLSRKDIEVVSALDNNQQYMSHSQYLASFDELDARNAALEYIKAGAQKLDSDSLMVFYNNKKIQEKNNGKKEISNDKKAYFGCIYDDDLFFRMKDGRKVLMKSNSQFSNRSNSQSEPGA